MNYRARDAAAGADSSRLSDSAPSSTRADNEELIFELAERGLKGNDI